jgi:hypothetical protein
MPNHVSINWLSRKFILSATPAADRNLFII